MNTFAHIDIILKHLFDTPTFEKQ